MDKKKKKEPINVEGLIPDDVSEEMYTCSILGRALAAFGAILTGREKHDAKLMHLLLLGKRGPSKDSMVFAELKQEPETKKYTPSEAIDWFTKKYPKRAQPLLKRLEENYTRDSTLISYGLRNQQIPSRIYVSILSEKLGISRESAEVLYHGVIKPYLERQQEESELVTMKMKSD